MKVATRIYGIVGVMAVALAVVATIGFYALQQKTAMSKVLDRTAREAFLLAEIDEWVTSAVLAWRGVYFGRTADEIRSFAPGVGENLRKIEAALPELAEVVGEATRPRVLTLEEELGAFAALRTGTVERALQMGNALMLMDTTIEEVRASRRALQALIDDLEDDVVARLEPMRADIVAFDRRMRTLVVSAALVGLVLGAGLAAFIGRQTLARPLDRLSGTLKRLAAGDLEVVVERPAGGGEIAEIWRATAEFRDELKAGQAAREEQARLAAEAEEARKVAARELAETFEADVSGVLSGVTEAIAALKRQADKMSRTASDATERSSAVATAAGETTSNVETVASAAEELAASVREIGQQVATAARISREAKDQADGTVGKVEGLASSAHRIGEVVGLIDDIAAQTNLLALNATIEAARAGEAGKGFAVVANEVKTLAEQTAKATGEISAQISAVQGETETVVKAIQEIAGTIRRIDEISTAIASAVEEQGAATGEIAQNVQEAARGTQNVSATIVDVSRAANDTGEASREIASASSALSREAETLSGRVSGFLKSVRGEAA